MPDGLSSSRLEDLQMRWQQDPESRVYLQLAEEYRKLDRHPEAIDVLKRGLRSRPNDLSGQVALGRCHLEMEELDAAAQSLETVVGRDPTHIVGNKLLLEAYLKTGNAEKAGERLDLYKLLNPSDPDMSELEGRLRSLRREAATPPVSAEPGAATTAEIPIMPDDSPAPASPEAQAPAYALFEEAAAQPESSTPDRTFETWPGRPAPTAVTSGLEPATDTPVRAPVEEPAPAAFEEPPPTAFEEPAPTVFEEPAPTVFEEPAPTVFEEPAPAVFEEPAPAVFEEPAPAVFEEPPSAALDESPPAALEESPPPDDDIFQLGPPAPAPSLDDLFELAPATAPPPSLDDLWESVPESVAEAEIPDPSVADGVAQAAAPEPVEEVAVAEPVEEVAAPEPVEELAAPEPVEELAAPEPIEEVAAPEPVEEVTAPEPIEEIAAAEPVEELAAVEPVEELTAPEPIEEIAAPEPVEEFAAVEPVEELTVAEPIEEVAAPVLVEDATAQAGVEEASSRKSGAEPAQDEPATATLGELYLKQGHVDEAEGIFRQVLRQDPGNAAALAGLERIRGEHGLTAHSLLARDPRQDSPMGLTAKKIRVLETYVQLLRQASG